MPSLGGATVLEAPGKNLTHALVSAGLLLAIGGCGNPTELKAANGAQWYHAHLATEEGDPIPFFLGLPDDCENEEATIVNGEEHLRAGCRRNSVGFVVDFPVYGTQIEAWFRPDGTLTGHWCRELSSTGREPILELKARPISEPDPLKRFPVEPGETDPVSAVVDVTGTWRMEIDEYGVGKGLFEQEASGVVTGTVEVSSQYGDVRFLAGNLRGTRLHLSTFDGQSALRLVAEVQPDGTMAGEWVTAYSGPRFVAERDDGFELPDPLGRIAFKSGEKLLDGAALPKEKYEGKPLILEIFGTWCPNCNDHAPLLVELYEKYHPAGLEILGLAFEYSDNQEYKERRVQEFKDKHGIEWDIVLAEGTIEDLTENGLSGLSPIEGVPVTVFLNRGGTVHAIYTGFSGPATGDAHHEVIAQFEKLTEEIISGL